MSIVLIGPLLAELGFTTTVAATAGEVVGATAGTAIAGAATGAVAAPISQAIDNAASRVYETVVPEEKRKTVNDIINNVVNAGKLIAYDDPSLLVRDRMKRDTGGKNRFMTFADQPQMDTSVLSFQRPPINTTITNPFGTTQPPLQQTLVDQPVSVTGYGNDFSKCLENGENPLTGQPGKTTLPDYSPKDLAQFTVDFANGVATQDGPIDAEKIIVQMTQMNPQNAELYKRITGYLQSQSGGKEVLDKFRQINKVYNMHGVTSANFTEKQVGNRTYYNGVDELGKSNIMEKNTSPFHLPAIYGVYGGPASPNNFLPGFKGTQWDMGEGGILADGVFYFHDFDFSSAEKGGGGYFNREADLRLISRLFSLIQEGRTRPEDNQLLISIIKYFCTYAPLLSSFTGAKSDLGQTIDIDVLNQDVYDVLVPSSRNVRDDRELQKDRYEFFNELEEQLTQISKTSSIMATVGIQNKVLSQQFGSIFVQVV